MSRNQRSRTKLQIVSKCKQINWNFVLWKYKLSLYTNIAQALFIKAEMHNRIHTIQSFSFHLVRISKESTISSSGTFHGRKICVYFQVLSILFYMSEGFSENLVTLDGSNSKTDRPNPDAPTDLETAAFALLQYYSIFLIRNSHPWYILLLKNGTTVQFWSLTLLKIKITIISPWRSA